MIGESSIGGVGRVFTSTSRRTFEVREGGGKGVNINWGEGSSVCTGVDAKIKRRMVVLGVVRVSEHMLEWGVVEKGQRMAR